MRRQPYRRTPPEPGWRGRPSEYNDYGYDKRSPYEGGRYSHRSNPSARHGKSYDYPNYGSEYEEDIYTRRPDWQMGKPMYSGSGRPDGSWSDDQPPYGYDPYEEQD